MSNRIFPLVATGLLALLLPACATDEVAADLNDSLAQQDEQVRAQLGGQLPAFDMQIGELARRHGLPARGSLRALRAETDELGMTHVRVQQTVDGVPVFQGEAIVHLGGPGRQDTVTDAVEQDLDVDTTPELDATDAEDLALAEDPDAQLLGDEPTLTVLRHDDGDHLVWMVDTEVLDADDAPVSNPRLFIDAHSGELVWSYDNLHSASGTTRYNGVRSFDTLSMYAGGGTYNYYLENYDVLTFTFGNSYDYATMIYDADDSWTESELLDSVSAHWGAQQTLDYLYYSSGWDGWDNRGSPVILLTDYGVGESNAWGGGGYVKFGDGDGTSWDPPVSLDVVGHEIGHSVSEAMVNLTYSGESGGLNESFSDILGAMTERYVIGDSWTNWWMGEDFFGPGTAFDALRYMDKPAYDGKSVDYYYSGVGAKNPHYSSGIGNLAFYLMANGGRHPTRSSSTMAGLGPDMAMAFTMRAYRYYLTSGADYLDLREAVTLAATDYYGPTSTQVATVGQAFDMVGVGSSRCEAGRLEGAGYADILPGGTWFYSSGGFLRGELDATAGTNVGLYLFGWNGSTWVNLAGSATGSGEQGITYGVGAGWYLWYAYSFSGAANYSFCHN